MKKIWKYAILLVALSALLCMSAFAADELKVNNFVPNAVAAVAGEEYFTATYTGQKDAQYLILMLAGTETGSMPDPTKTKILYVNQAQANAEGVVKFETVYPMALEDSVIWLTGGTDGPVALASIDVPEPVGVTVSGTAASWNSTDDAVYLLYADTVEDATIKAEWKAGTYATAGNVVYTGTKGTITAATVDGKAMQSQGFSFAGVANGTYKLAIFKPVKYVPKIVTVTVSGSDVELGTQKLWLYGDVTYDGNVNAIDALQIQLKSVGSSSFFDVGTEADKAEKMAAANVSEPLLGDTIVNAIDALQIKLKSSGAASAFDEIK